MRAMRRDCDGDSETAAPRAVMCRAGLQACQRKRTMDRKQFYRLALGIAGAGVAMMAMPSVAFAQEATKAAGEATFLTSQGAAWLGGSIGAGLAIIGGAAGIGRIGGSAVE